MLSSLVPKKLEVILLEVHDGREELELEAVKALAEKTPINAKSVNAKKRKMATISCSCS